MQGNLDVFTLILLVVAVVIALKLRSVLGRRTGDEHQRLEQRYKAEQEREAAMANRDKVVQLPRREQEPVSAEVAQREEQEQREAQEQRMRGAAAGNDSLLEGLKSIFRADTSFDPEHFLKGAKQAYEMIVTAFAEGNRKTLKPLLSKEVYDGFVAAISDRESRNEQIDQSFVGINKADIVEAEIKDNFAHVTIKFVSELISATRDKAGNVTAGDPKRIKEVTDIWTFGRDVRSRDPNWKLVATQAAN